ncbi:DUF554 domain-containing protein [Lactiplantibacillus mudanjiangensis]|uniref:Transport protein [Lactobacillus plantarum JDM1] n=1 Tax=Lactiplantibacillus mudanjiangensis TaxID=1296538 RepID=A0A660DVG2_9LACO|nr:DUF554 domain-containing protein [Lactiplantibacillus mudanjiangensis]VDG20007.1 transport protein [Lactobacillus plantarum JDM1] [Lactiplantibacillus mudanjiangensis]VDG26167.1 transport protein [Lactobacillus plantarum JDM1] [Lactiplantibacillus mudanjiangensis]VDG27320.1 transport protein [Lactobacillus plantarum JDM1] [Lactiplantibacillus mudanjiangensis]VDG33401.1 transport protein [Lactobacillus plantarum JDM1] [Lactiplantibacillus mudanjiangensis]
MIGTIFNVTMILVGCTVGSVFKKGIKPAYHDILMQALGLAATVIGINAVVQRMPQSKYPVLFIVSLALGGIIGQALDLQGRFDKLVGRFSGGNLAEGLATAILLYCIGSLSILGPIEAALKHDYTFLFTNGMLDGITSIVLASTFGFGIAIAAGVLFVWQGSIYVLALVLKSALSTVLINEITIVGGILILASGLGLLKIKQINTLNLLPALIVPPIAIAILQLF